MCVLTSVLYTHTSFDPAVTHWIRSYYSQPPGCKCGPESSRNSGGMLHAAGMRPILTGNMEHIYTCDSYIVEILHSTIQPNVQTSQNRREGQRKADGLTEPQHVRPPWSDMWYSVLSPPFVNFQSPQDESARLSKSRIIAGSITINYFEWLNQSRNCNYDFGTVDDSQRSLWFEEIRKFGWKYENPNEQTIAMTNASPFILS